MNKNQAPFNSAVWIAPTEPTTAAKIYKTFICGSKIKKAKLYITGLGYFEAYIGGKSLTSDMLIPPASDYFPRDLSRMLYPTHDKLTHRIYYHIFDVADKLTEGENLLEITLGGGWLTQSDRIAEGEAHYSDRPMCIFRLVIESESSEQNEIISDPTALWSECEIRRTSLFYGEDWDFCFTPEKKPTTAIPSPKSILTEAVGQNDKIIREITPTLIYEDNGRRIYDLGENISGLVRLSTNAPRGAKYTLTFAENYLDGALDCRSSGSEIKGRDGKGQIMRDTVIFDGTPRTFMPKFIWHAFRYFEIEGELDCITSLSACVIHADVNVTSHLETDSEGLSFLYDAYIRTQLSSYHGSFPSDCPHRERLGYTGDGQITASSAMSLLGAKELYRKWIRDILDSQDKESGHIQHTAPFQGGGGGPGGWCSAVITVPYAYFKEYKEADILSDALPAMKRYIEFTYRSAENGLVVREIDGGWCLGDWCMMESAKLPEPFVNTCWFVHSLRLYLELLEAVGSPGDEESDNILTECLSALKREYPKYSHIGAAMAYAAWIGIADTAPAAEHYNSLGYFDTGFLGTDILLDVLYRDGYGKVAGKLLSSEREGSFLYMKRNGATTIWERWHGKNNCSHSHPMFGAAVRHIFSGALGIKQADRSYGYEKITFSPSLPEGSSFIKGSILTPKGRIYASVYLADGEIKSELSLPDGIKLVKK